MINVTKTFLPPQDQYNTILKRAWDKSWMTNRGVLVKELEEKLKAYLGVPNIIATTNGTLPLQIAIKALQLKGEVITTPFSYVATTSSIVWECCIPVFVDIHPEYLTIDETKIEAAITSRTTAILATHVFGNPCHIEAIDTIAKKHNLKVIYDAAHCFGVTYKEQSIFNYGDVSICSFHATKLFHTGEGGAIFCKQKYFESIFLHHNFGHKTQETFNGIGINAKMSELQAAMGLSILPYMDDVISERRVIVELYLKLLKGVEFIKIREETNWNFSYFPIKLDSEAKLLKLFKILNQHNIFPRRYFYPSLNTLDYVSRQECPVSEDIASRILCLPLYYGLKEEEVKNIINLINV